MWEDVVRHRSASRARRAVVIQYLVVFEKTSNNYAAYVPDLPGLGVTGDTREEVEHNIRKALTWHLEAMTADGEPIPEPTSWAEMLEASGAA
jgi:predicted RNase H-like HicB family nuclease